MDLSQRCSGRKSGAGSLSWQMPPEEITKYVFLGNEANKIELWILVNQAYIFTFDKPNKWKIILLQPPKKKPTQKINEYWQSCQQPKTHLNKIWSIGKWCDFRFTNWTLLKLNMHYNASIIQIKVYLCICQTTWSVENT